MKATASFAERGNGDALYRLRDRLEMRPRCVRCGVKLLLVRVMDPSAKAAGLSLLTCFGKGDDGAHDFAPRGYVDSRICIRRRLVAARIEKRRKQTPKPEKPGEGEADEDKDERGPDSPNEAAEAEGDQGSVQESVDEDIEEIMEVCPYCGSPSSAWERRPPEMAEGESDG